MEHLTEEQGPGDEERTVDQGTETDGPPADAASDGDRMVATGSVQALPSTKRKVVGHDDTQQLPHVADEPVPPVDDFDDFDDDEEDDEEDRRRAETHRRRRATQLTAALALVAAIGVGFVSGVFFQKHQGTTGSSAAGSSGIAAFLRGRGAGGTGSGFAGFGGGTSSASSGLVTGSVSAISGATLYISSGTSSALTKVVTVPSSTITVPTSGTLADIQPGDTVVVRGAQQKDGSFAAASITDSGTASTGAAGGALTAGSRAG